MSLLDIFSVVLPVFVVIGAGWLARHRCILTDSHVDGLMKYGQGVAIPVLLFRAISQMDLSAHMDLRLLAAFYGGAGAGFLAGLLGARFLFGRDWEDAVAIGFVGLFSNSLLLGLSMTERAYGAEALAANYTIIAVHAPVMYGIGITAMELARARKGGTLRGLLPKVLRAMFSNPLVIGIGCGFALNLSGLTLPEAAGSGLDLLARGGIPAALFGLGGVLYRYRPEGDMGQIPFIVAVSLMLHPAVTWGLGRMLDLQPGALRSAVLTASVAPGVNAYLFADMYGRARRVAASAVLIGTAGTILSSGFWLIVLGLTP